jgi:hypothetical protein
MLPDFVTKLDAFTAKEYSVHPGTTNSASEIGGNCLRFLVYRRTSWEVQKEPSLKLKRIFEEGNVQERAVQELLMNAGYAVIGVQTSMVIDEPGNLTGHVDGMINVDGVLVPFDIKSMSEHIW